MIFINNRRNIIVSEIDLNKTDKMKIDIYYDNKLDSRGENVKVIRVVREAL